jgi:hypothetical protein
VRKRKTKLGGRGGHGAKMGAASRGSTPKLHAGKGPHLRGAPKTKATAPRGKTPAPHRGGAAAAAADGDGRRRQARGRAR